MKFLIHLTSSNLVGLLRWSRSEMPKIIPLLAIIISYEPLVTVINDY